MPRIKCDQYDYENDRWGQYEIDMELNLWPCCHFYTDKLSKGKVNESIEHIEINLRKNNMENIIGEYEQVMNSSIWKTDKAPHMCVKTCSVLDDK